MRSFVSSRALNLARGEGDSVRTRFQMSATVHFEAGCVAAWGCLVARWVVEAVQLMKDDGGRFSTTDLAEFWQLKPCGL